MKLVYRWQFISIFTELKLDYNPWFMIYIYIYIYIKPHSSYSSWKNSLTKKWSNFFLAEKRGQT
jgi:hypothetical protein